MTAYEIFAAEFPCRELDYTFMVMDEAKATIDRTACPRPTWAAAVSHAEAMVLTWARTAHEYNLDPADPGRLASFLCSHRRACTWAVLLGLQKLQSNNGQKAN